MNYEYKSLSSNSLKQSLYQSLDKKGVLEGLKAQLRSNLLKNVLAEKNTTKEENVIFSQKYLNNIEGDRINMIKIACSIFSEFLKKNNLNYSHSVFIPEIGIQDLYSEKELLSYLKEKMNNFESSDESIILNLLKTINNSNRSRKELESVLIQTDPENNLDIDEKLRLIDSKYLSKVDLDKLMPSKLIEEKNIKFQRELEVRLRNEMQIELSRMKEIELSHIRISEKNNYTKKLEEMRDDFEKKYLERIKQLKDREKESESRLLFRENEIEKSLNNQREKFQESLKYVKIKEDELMKKYENEFNKLKLDNDRLSFKEKQLEIRLKEVDYIQECANRKIKEEIEQFKLEYDRKYEVEKIQLSSLKKNVEEKEFRNTLFNEKYTKMEEDSKQLMSENSNYHKKIKEFENMTNNLRKDNDFLREELKLITNTEKRSTGLIEIKEKEIFQLKEEIRILKDSLDNYVKTYEERKSEQNILIQEFKNKLEDKNREYAFMKEDYRNENERMKKHLNELLEKEKLNNKEKSEESKKNIEELSSEIMKYKTLYGKANRRLFELGSDLEGNIPVKAKIPEVIKNDFSETSQNKFSNLKTSERLQEWSKLERELEDNKNKLKNVFSHKLDHNKFNPVQSELYETFMIKKMKEISDQKTMIDNYTKIRENQSQEISDKIYSQLKNDLLKQSMQAMQENHVINLLNNNTANINNNISNNFSNNEKNSDKANYIQENINDKQKEDTVNFYKTNREEKESEIKSTNEDINKFNQTNNMKEIISKSENNNNNSFLPTPVIIKNDNLDSDKTRDDKNYREKEENKVQELRKQITPKETDRFGSNNDISVGNVSSSEGYNFESNRKDSFMKPENKLLNEEKNINEFSLKNNYNKEEVIINNKPSIINSDLNEKTKGVEIKNPSINLVENTQIKKDVIIENNISKKPHVSVIEEEESRNISNLLGGNKKDDNSQSTSRINKFQNYEYTNDKKDDEIAEEIKTENDDEYGGFDDVDLMSGEFKGIKESRDLEAIKNASMGFGYSTINNNISNVYMGKSNNNQIEEKKSKVNPNNISKSSSINVDKFIQSKNSNEDDIEEKYSYEEFGKKYAISNNNINANSIDEDSTLRKNDNISAKKKDSSRKENSDIKEEIASDIYEEAFEPVSYD